MPDEQLPSTPAPDIEKFSQLIRGPVINVDSEEAAYRSERAKIAEKSGGMIPLAEGWIVGLDMGQKGAGEVMATVRLRIKNMDQLALMAAPMHDMKVLILEDRRQSVRR